MLRLALVALCLVLPLRAEVVQRAEDPGRWGPVTLSLSGRAVLAKGVGIAAPSGESLALTCLAGGGIGLWAQPIRPLDVSAGARLVLTGPDEATRRVRGLPTLRVEENVLYGEIDVEIWARMQEARRIELMVQAAGAPQTAIPSVAMAFGTGGIAEATLACPQGTTGAGALPGVHINGAWTLRPGVPEIGPSLVFNPGPYLLEGLTLYCGGRLAVRGLPPGLADGPASLRVDGGPPLPHRFDAAGLLTLDPALDLSSGRRLFLAAGPAATPDWQRSFDLAGLGTLIARRDCPTG